MPLPCLHLALIEAKLSCLADLQNSGNVDLFNITTEGSNMFVPKLSAYSNLVLQLEYPITEQAVYEAAVVVNSSVVAYVARSNGASIHTTQGFQQIFDVPTVGTSVKLEALPILHAPGMWFSTASDLQAWLAIAMFAGVSPLVD